jgi:hypothetical protein
MSSRPFPYVAVGLMAVGGAGTPSAACAVRLRPLCAARAASPIRMFPLRVSGTRVAAVALTGAGHEALSRPKMVLPGLRDASSPPLQRARNQCDIVSGTRAAAPALGACHPWGACLRSGVLESANSGDVRAPPAEIRTQGCAANVTGFGAATFSPSASPAQAVHWAVSVRSRRLVRRHLCDGA